MDANKAENAYLEKLEDDWQQIPQFAEMWNRPQNAIRMANTRKGYRRSADSPIVKLAISKERLKKAGYAFLLDCYLEVTA